MTEEIVETTYGDLYLKFSDEATAFALLYKPVMQIVVTYNEEGMSILTEKVVEGEFIPRYTMDIDIIGIIYKINNTDSNNPIYTAQEGWHINTRGEMPEELVSFAIIPVHPHRVWA